MPQLIKYLSIIAIILLLGTGKIMAQKTTKVKLIRSDELLMDDHFNKDIQRLIGNVVMLHDSTYFYCDSAWLNRKANNFQAFSKVHIIVSDTLEIFSDSLNYDGSTRIADLYGHVKLVGAVTSHGSENISGHALGVNPNQNRLL